MSRHRSTSLKNALRSADDEGESEASQGRHTTLTKNIFDATSELEDVFIEPEGADPLTQPITITFQTSGLVVTTGQAIGQGAFGTVFAARNSLGEECAVKMNRRNMTDAEWGRLVEEVTLLRHFTQHPNTVRFFTAGRTDNVAYVVMELCRNKSLNDVVSRHPLDIDEILWVGYQLVKTVEYLNRKGCVHRDLKPANLLFDEHGNLKITDFGLASRISDEKPRKTIAGTMLYMAPELANQVFQRKHASRLPGAGGHATIDDLRYGCEVDAWSVGVVLFVMATSENPYFRAGKPTQEEFLRAVCQVKWSWPSTWDGDEEFTEVVNWILNANQAQRPTIHDIASHHIWTRRPLVCPLSLQQTLGLIPQHPSSASFSLSRQSMSVSLSALTATVNTNTTNTTHQQRAASSGVEVRPSSSSLRGQSAHAQIQRHFADALVIVQQEESRARAAFVENVRAALLSVKGRVQLLLSECQDRLDVEELEAVRRGKLLESKQAFLPPSLPAMTSRPPIPAAQRIRSREGSVIMIDSYARGAPPHPPRSSIAAAGTTTPTTAASNSRSSLAAVSVPPMTTTTSAAPVAIQCMNRHKMERHGKMPAGYKGFDCNVCDQPVLKITEKAYMYRCEKCDYDVCNQCAEARKFKEVHFLCAKCGKKFPSQTKLQYHSRGCRGPSVASPEFDRGVALMLPAGQVGTFPLTHSNVWEETPPTKQNSSRNNSTRNTSSRRTNTTTSSARSSQQNNAMLNFNQTYGDPLNQSEDLSPQPVANMRAPLPLNSPQATYQYLSQNSSFVVDKDEQRLAVRRHAPEESMETFFTAEQMLADSVRLSTHGRPSSSRSSGGGSLRRPDGQQRLVDIHGDTEEMLPSSVGQLSKRLREEAAKGQQKTIRTSMEISPPKRKSRKEDFLLQQEANFEFKTEMLQEPVGIAAQRQQSRAREASLSPTFRGPPPPPQAVIEVPPQKSRTSGGKSSPSPNAQVPTGGGGGRVVIRASPSDQLAESRQQPGVERKIFSTHQSSEQGAAAAHSPSPNHKTSLPLPPPPPLVVPTHGPAARQFGTPQQKESSSSSSTAAKREYVSNALVDSQGRIVPSPSSSGQLQTNMRSDPTLFPSGSPSGGLGGPRPLQGVRGHTASVRQGSLSRMPTPAEIVVPVHHRGPTPISGGTMHPMSMPMAAAASSGANNNASPLSRTNAYLALPKQTADRAAFVEAILSGPWVRYFVFGADTTCFVHYSLQPGRFGGSFSIAPGVMGTIVIDVNTRNVLHVPATNIDTQTRSEPHPNVQTFFSDEIHLLSIHEARTQMPSIVTSVMNFATMVIQHQREGLTPNAVAASFLHQPEATSVPATTKFAYLRKVFPDPQRTTVVFRLSNLRSQVVSLVAGVDIRWQSDRFSNIGTKYYVYPTGHTEPFAEDRTGILQYLQTVLENSYRR